MKIGNLNTKDKVIIVAEIGNNHEGDYNLAEELIALASDSGADAVKFQTFKTEDHISITDKKRFKLIKSFELNKYQFRSLSKYATEKQLSFISTPFDIESALYLDDIVDAIKISSSDNNFFPLLKTVAEGNSPIIMSTGLLNIDDLQTSINYIVSKAKNKTLKEKLAILHCVTSYPTKPKYANLNAIKTLKRKLNYTIGYSDHTLGLNAAITSVGLGARIIEKHFTKDKNLSDFQDHKLSANPDEFNQMVRSIREVEIMLGSGEKNLQPPENLIKESVRRSIIAKRDIKKGTRLSESDISWVRPGGGIPSEETSNIIGKKLKENILMGQKILYQNLL